MACHRRIIEKIIRMRQKVEIEVREIIDQEIIAWSLIDRLRLEARWFEQVWRSTFDIWWSSIFFFWSNSIFNKTIGLEGQTTVMTGFGPLQVRSGGQIILHRTLLDTVGGQLWTPKMTLRTLLGIKKSMVFGPVLQWYFWKTLKKQIWNLILVKKGEGPLPYLNNTYLGYIWQWF